MRSQLAPMKKVARMLRGHRDLLLNGFRAKGQLSSGSVEGFNTKAKLTTRKAFGFRTYHALEIALYQHLGLFPNQNSPTDSAEEPKILLTGFQTDTNASLCILMFFRTRFGKAFSARRNS